jgi:hypothetical protein
LILTVVDRGLESLTRYVRPLVEEVQLPAFEPGQP